MPVCRTCGANVNPNANFCERCGASLKLAHQQATNAVPPPPPPPPPPQTQVPKSMPPQPRVPQANGEQVFGVMLLRKPKSLGRYDAFTGVVTTQRMIFAQMTSEMLKDAIQAARNQAKAEGKGFMGQWQEQLKASFGFTQRYLTMPPAAALSETPSNFAVNNQTIREVKLKLKDINKGQDMEMHEFELEVASSQGKVQFRMDERGEYVNLLKRVYGERVKMPFGYFPHGVRIGH